MRETEQRKKLVNYIHSNLKKGYTLESLRWALINQDYSRALVDKAIEEANQEMANKAPLVEDKPKISYEVMNEFNQPVTIEKPWWKRMFGL